MTVGDLIEIVAGLVGFGGALLVVAGLVSWVVGFGVALLVLCAFLVYQGQVWASTQLFGSTEEPPAED